MDMFPYLMLRIFPVCCLIFSLSTAFADVGIRSTLILTQAEQQQLRQRLRQQADAAMYWQKLLQEVNPIMDDAPRPMRIIYYEGLLDTDPKRIDTEKHLQDMDKLAVLLYAYYGTADKQYALKAREYILAWTDAYQATGNPINENKLEPLIHAYYITKAYFSSKEQEKVNSWLLALAEAEKVNNRIPNNNWKAKQIKLIGTIGLILGNPSLVAYAIENFKTYIGNALYADGTSHDLHQRDALSYHVSGLKPLLTFAILLDQFKPNLEPDFFSFQTTQGSSLKKSVDYVVPYARGEKTHKEWVHTKVALDKERARAGIAHYQSGKLYDPRSSQEMFELASYFDTSYQEVIQSFSDKQGFSSWWMVIIDVARNAG